MLTVNSLNPDKRLSVILAVFFAEGVLPIFEKEFPENKRPREAVEAAKAWIVNPCRETANAAANAAYAAYAANAANAANAASAYAASAYAAYAAAHAAAHAAHAADAAAYAAAAHANAAVTHAAASAHAANAAHAARYTANAANAQSKLFYIHKKLLMLLPQILEYKIHSKNRFESAEEVFALLPKQSQQRFLFHIDCLR
jgi:hypothetical protein